MLLEGKHALVYGVANHRSFAWHIAQALSREGARICLTYQTERLEKNVRGLGETLPDTVFVQCDVTDDEELQHVTDVVADEFGKLDVLIHAVAYAKKEELSGRYVDTSREGYLLAQEVSAYSLAAMCRPVLPLFQAAGGGSVVTLTYLGAERAVVNYNVMGVAKAALESSVRYLAVDLGPDNVRVNGISAGPVRTLASSAVSGFRSMLREVAERSPLKRNVEQAEVADSVLFLASDMSRGITGEIIHVDAGYSIVGI